MGAALAVSVLALAGCAGGGGRWAEQTDGEARADGSSAEAVSQLGAPSEATRTPTGTTSGADDPVAPTGPVPTTPPAATTPAGPIGAPDPARETRTIAGVRAKPFAQYPGRVSLAARGSRLVVATGGPDGLQVLTSIGGALPQPIAGLAPIWFLSNVHLGTDAAGDPVLTYARCSDETLGSCDLYAWNARTRKEAPIAAANTKRFGETEAVMDEGNLVFARERSRAWTVDDVNTEGRPVNPSLFSRPRGGEVALLTDEGGHGLDFADGLVAYVADDPEAADEAGVCGVSQVRLIDLVGAQRYERSVVCGLNGQSAAGLAIQEGHLRFAIAQVDQTATAIDVTIATGATATSPLRTRLRDFRPLSASSGYALEGRACVGEWDFTEGLPADPCRVTRLTGVRPGGG